MTLSAPDIDYTCNVGGRVIDYLFIYPCLVPLMISVSALLVLIWKFPGVLIVLPGFV